MKTVDEKLLLLLGFSVALFAGWRLDFRAARASELSVNFHLSTVLSGAWGTTEGRICEKRPFNQGSIENPTEAKINS
jgi:hypothetical protein